MTSQPRSYDVVQLLYGINILTLNVESVRVTQGGTMTMLRGGSVLSHQCRPGPGALPAAELAYGLRDIVEVMVGDEQTASRVRAQLREKAAAMTAPADSAAKTT